MAEPRASVLFVCLGNICRSPTAEAVMRSLLEEEGLGQAIEVDSAGTGSWHVGHPPDERASAAASARGVELAGAARRVSPEDLDRYDHVIAMDRDNLAELRRIAGPEHEPKLAMLRCFDERARDAGELEVPDPYYGGAQGFELVLDAVERGCRGLLRHITETHRIGADGNA